MLHPLRGAVAQRVARAVFRLRVTRRTLANTKTTRAGRLMARLRSIKPEYWMDRKLARLLSRDERMLYVGLWNQADEHGRCLGDPRVVQGAVFPYEDDLSPAAVDGMLEALVKAGVVVRYVVDEDPYLWLPKLAQHQRLEPEKVASRHPAPDDPGVVRVSSARDADESARDADESARDADESALKHVACGIEHVAGKPSSATADAWFTEFWQHYPRKVGKQDAARAFHRQRRKHPAEAIIAGAERLAADPHLPEPQFIPHPATWLSRGGWDDEPYPSPPGRGVHAEEVAARWDP